MSARELLCPEDAKYKYRFLLCNPTPTPLHIPAIFQFFHAQNTFSLNTIQEDLWKNRLFLKGLCGFHISKPALLGCVV